MGVHDIHLAVNGTDIISMTAIIGDLPMNKSLGGPQWGIDASGNAYCDTAGATGGELAYIALDAYGNPFMTSAHDPGAPSLLMVERRPRRRGRRA